MALLFVATPHRIGPEPARWLKAVALQSEDLPRTRRDPVADRGLARNRYPVSTEDPR